MPEHNEIKSLEEEIRNTKYNKHTQYHIGKLKAKLARLREEKEKGRGTGVGGKQYSVKKTGDATVVLMGSPSVGKSTLINSITNVESKVGHYDFTTLDVIPGVLEYNSANIQVLDIPGVIMGASSGKGRGKEIMSVVRNADLIVIMADRKEQVEVVRKELYGAGFRLDTEKPKVIIKKSSSGGIKIGSTVRLTMMDQRMIKDIMGEYGIHNAEVLLREDASPDRFIDSLCRNRVYVPSLVVFNKMDRMAPPEIEGIIKMGWLPVSAKTGENLDEFKREVWKRLGLMRVYMKKIGKDPDMDEPLIMNNGCTVSDVARRIHREWKAEFARLWGPSARFDGQRVSPSKKLRDRDVVELHLE